MASSHITWHAFDPDLRITIIQGDLTIPVAVQHRAEEIWHAALQRKDNSLYNGPLFSVEDFDRNTITVRQTQFKYFHAQITDVTSSPKLWLRPLACSGVLTCNAGVIFAQRSKKVTLDQGLWELAPSGTFDASCVVDKIQLSSMTLIRTEMFEELGIPDDRIIGSGIKGGITNSKTGALDLVMELEIDADAVEIKNYFTNRPSDEYSDIRIIPVSAINEFVSEFEEEISNSSKTILRALSLI